MGDGSQFKRHWEFVFCVIFAVLSSVWVIAYEAEEFTVPPCPENEYFRICLGNCTNCEQRGRCPEIRCDTSGCDCMPHYVRLKPDGPCEPVSKCPPRTCGENEVFRACGPICETCGTLTCRILSCEYKCYCKEGFLRNSEGKCIPKDECPPKRRCTIGEERRDSGPSDQYCLQDGTEVVSNSTVTKEGCYCIEGHKRNLMGHCTADDFCEFVKCRNVEKYKNCPPKCNTTCRNYGDSTCKEDGQCYPGCFCPEGYLMNDHRACVKIEECPPGSNPLAPTAAPTTPELTTQTLSTDQTTPTPTATTAQTESVTPTVTEEGTTSGTTSESGSTTDETTENTTASDFSTVPDATTPKPKRAKQAKDPQVSKTKAPKSKPDKLDLENENK